MPEAVRARPAETRKRGMLEYARDKARRTRIVLARATVKLGVRLAGETTGDIATKLLIDAGREKLEVLAGKGLEPKTLSGRIALHEKMLREMNKISSVPHLETEIGVSVLPRLFHSLKVEVATFDGGNFDLSLKQADHTQSFMVRALNVSPNTEVSSLIKRAFETDAVAVSEKEDKIGIAFMAQSGLCGFAVLSGKITQDDITVASMLKGSVGNTFENAIRLGKLYEQISKDALTGIYNRGHFDGQLKVEAMRAGRKEGSRVSIIMIDIDKFKDVNDIYGHQSGDEVLKAVASRIAGSVRETDHACRYGGEEFAVILPDTPLEGAIKLAEKIRAAVACDKVGDKIEVAVSIGVANLPYHIGKVKTGEEHDAVIKLVEAADQALYKAKENGRNQVRVCVNGEWIPAGQALIALESTRTSREAEVNRELADDEHNTRKVTGEGGSKGSSTDGQKP